MFANVDVQCNHDFVIMRVLPISPRRKMIHQDVNNMENLLEASEEENFISLSSLHPFMKKFPFPTASSMG